MAIDSIGAGTAIPLTANAANSLAPAPLDEARQVAGQLAAAADINPVAAQAQAQGVVQTDQQQQDGDAARQERNLRQGRGSVIDIVV